MLCLVFLLAASVAPAASVATYNATTANVSGAPDAIRINILRWSTDAERDKLMDAWMLKTPSPARGGRGGGRGAGRAGRGAARHRRRPKPCLPKHCRNRPLSVTCGLVKSLATRFDTPEELRTRMAQSESSSSRSAAWAQSTICGNPRAVNRPHTIFQ